MPNFDFRNIFCQLGWHDLPLFPPLWPCTTIRHSPPTTLHYPHKLSRLSSPPPPTTKLWFWPNFWKHLYYLKKKHLYHQEKTLLQFETYLCHLKNIFTIWKTSSPFEKHLYYLKNIFSIWKIYLLFEKHIYYLKNIFTLWSTSLPFEYNLFQLKWNKESIQKS